MKIRPYRVCDICGEEYHKTHNCMKVKILIDPMRYTEMYGDLPIMSKWDICPKCAEDLMAELMLKVADRKTESNSEKPNNCEDEATHNQHVQRVEYVGNNEKSRCWTCKHFERMHETPIASDGNYYTYVVCTAKECHYEPKDEPQSPKEFAEKMQAIAEVRDPEERHIKMDDLMCELLKLLGYGEGIKIFEDMEKWYS